MGQFERKEILERSRAPQSTGKHFFARQKVTEAAGLVEAAEIARKRVKSKSKEWFCPSAFLRPGDCGR